MNPLVMNTPNLEEVQYCQECDLIENVSNRLGPNPEPIIFGGTCVSLAKSDANMSLSTSLTAHHSCWWWAYVSSKPLHEQAERKGLQQHQPLASLMGAIGGREDGKLGMERVEHACKGAEMVAAFAIISQPPSRADGPT